MTRLAVAGLDAILDGLVAELELERELGVRMVPCDRSLVALAAADEARRETRDAPQALAGRSAPHVSPTINHSPSQGEDALPTWQGRPRPCSDSAADRPLSPPRLGGAPAADQPPSQPSLGGAPTADRPLIAFVHADSPLAPECAMMLTNIRNRLGLTEESAPLVFTSAPPEARVVVVLGSIALRKFYPDVKPAACTWAHTPDGRKLLVTYSLEYFLRFKRGEATSNQLKTTMLNFIKVALQHARNTPS